MATLEIVLRARNMTGDAIKKVVSDVKDLDKSSKGASSSMQNAGSQARSALGGVAEISRALGANLDGALGSAARLADGVGDITSALRTMSASLGILTAAGLAVGYLTSEIEKAKAASAARLAEVARPFEETERAIQALNRKDALADLASSIGATVDEVKNLGKESDVARERLILLNNTRKEIELAKASQAQLEDAQSKLAPTGFSPEGFAAFVNQVVDAFANGAFSASEYQSKINALNIEQLETIRLSRELAATARAHAQAENERRLALEYSADAAVRLALALGDMRGESIDGRREDARALSEYRTQVQWGNMEFKEGVGWVNKYDEALRLRNIDTATRKQQQFNNALMGVVRAAMQSTKVTEEDMGLAALGKYQDKWDELARQADDVAITPENIAKYAELSKALQQTGLSAGEFARQFRDMSLFANPANMNLVNWDAFTEGLKAKIRGMIGEAALMKRAFQEALASLSPQELAAFTKALDLDPSAAGNVDKLFDAFSGQNADETKNTLGAMATNLSQIEGTHTSTLNFVWEKAKSAIDEAHQYIQDKILQYADILIEITARFTPPTGGGPGGSSGGGSGGASPEGRASGGYVGNGLYRLGEMGREYVLPHNMVKYIESVLGGPIKDPDQIGWLIGALERGPQETANQLQLWASGIAGWGTDTPDATTKWIDKVYERYARMHGDAAVPAGAQSSGSGATPNAGAGSGGFGEGLPVLREIAATLRRIEKNTALGAGTIQINGNLDMKEVTKQVSREIGRRAFMRSAMGV